MPEETVASVLVKALHVASWALCYGAITYTYFRLNRQMRRFTRSDDEYEAFAAATANGLQWWTFGTTALAAASGVALATGMTPLSSPHDVPWAVLIGVKAVGLVALIALQAYVSWVMWPRRRRAPRHHWPAERRRFFWAAYLIGFLLIAQLVLGTLTHAFTAYAAR